MKFTIIDAPQRSPEWFLARAGRVTGSRADCIQAAGKGGAESVKRRDYRLELACEILTGVPTENTYSNAAMEWGVQQEPFARAAYEAHTGNVVTETGFLSADEHRAGCSLDGSVDDFEGIIELKCPKTSTHLTYLWAGKIPTDYIPQLTHNMLVSGAQWCDFASYDPRLPGGLRLFVQRVTREELPIPEYRVALAGFLLELDREVEALREMAKLP
jgi:putative phage-type endonuclease